MAEAKRSLLWASGVAITAALLAPFMPACFTRACDGDSVDFGKNPGEGMLIDQDTWQSSPIDGKWIPYPHKRYYHFDVGPSLGLRTPQDIRVYIAAVEQQNTDGANFAEAAGSLAEYSYIYPGTVSIYNNTCADYYMHVQIKVAPYADSGTPDAAIDNDAATDAGADDAAITDAALD